jgi:tetratricopeptide (TPR) repeat protein
LAELLKEQGKFAEAVEWYRRADALARKNPMVPVPYDPLWLRMAERAVVLDERWPAFLGGEDRLRTPEQRVEWADFAHRYKRRHALAARLYSEAFTARPELTADHRYWAARAAAWAGVGKGDDAPPDGPERVRLRKQALGWLRADLAELAARAKGADPDDRREALFTLGAWEREYDFTDFRGAAVRKLPDGERVAWEELWADVATVLRPAEDSPGSPRD